MDLASFRASLTGAAPPPGASLALQALWWAAKGEWRRAHECAQADGGPAGSLVHAYLHRVAGDLTNARHWYRRAGRPASTGPLAAEWQALAIELLASEQLG